MERTFYRIIKHPAASEDDFKPARLLGKPLRDPDLERQWAEGVSVYDTVERAVNRARRFRYKLGRYVVAIRVPADASVEIEQVGSDPRHYTLYGEPGHLLSLTDASSQRIDEERP